MVFVAKVNYLQVFFHSTVTWVELHTWVVFVAFEHVTLVIVDVTKATLQGIIRSKVNPDSIIHSDGWRGYYGLVDVGYDKHFRVHHGKNEFVRGNSHINGIESFWSYAKIRLVKFHGMDKRTFNLHLKECEFRFNNRGQDLYKLLLKIFRKEPLN